MGNVEEDKPEWHAFDTVKGGDYLVDQNAADIMAQEAVQAIYDLENRGLPFNRTPEGRIDQRRFGGHTRNFGEAPVKRACYAADRTGHMILQTLYQQCIKNKVTFYDEFQVIDLLMEGNTCQGVVAMELATGELHVFAAKAVMFATGGFGRLFKITSNAFANTGDGPAVCARRGIPLEDMEFFQFHPTGIMGLGILISEAVRGEGGILRNRDAERFMERYTPTLLDLAPRDIVARSIMTEVLAGRGLRGDRRIDDYVHLDATQYQDHVVFMHNIQEGPANRSFGLQVAKLAGIPGPVLKAAREKLQELERGEQKTAISSAQAPSPAQNDLFSAAQPHPVIDLLEALDVDDLSPREALAKLYELKSQLD